MQESGFVVNENADHLDIVSLMTLGKRLLLLLLALIPLVAPYELVLRVRWTDYVNPFFVFAAIISSGAVALSGLIIFAAVAGLNSRMTFNASTSTFTYEAAAPVIPRFKRVYPLSSLKSVRVHTNEWSDGPPSYCLVITMSDGTAFSSASSASNEYAEKSKDRIEAFLQRGA